MNAQRVEHGAQRTARDDASTHRRRTQNHLARAVTAVDVVMQRAAFAERNAHQRLLRRFRRLTHGFRHFARLAVTEADAALLVANDDERRKAETLTALHNLRNAIDVNELVDEFAALAIATAVAIAVPAAITAAAAAAAWLFLLLLHRTSVKILSKLQAAFAGRIAECLDPAVIDVTAAIEDDVA